MKPFDSVMNPFVWRSMTRSLANTPGTTQWRFETPYVDPSTGTQYYFQSTLAVPSVAKVPNVSGGGTTDYPGLLFPTININQAILAADAEGDGIADSGLFRLPVGDINGVSYFAGVRIIDNNSAINVNSAWSKSAEFTQTYLADNSTNTPPTQPPNYK